MAVHSTPIAVARVDGDTNRLLVQRFRVTGFPSFYLVRGASVTRFTGGHSVDSLVRFAVSGGSRNGKLVRSMLGPFHPYWRAVGALAVRADRAHSWVLESRRNMTIAAACAGLSVLAVLVLFTTFIHLLTKPPPPRPHTE